MLSDNYVKHLNAIKKYNANGVLFEFGAGKSLLQNLFLSQHVLKQIVVDLNPMLDLTLVEEARSLLANAIKLPSNKLISSRGDLIDYGIEYKAPFDACETGFPENSIDVCVSTNTLEHIPQEKLFEIFLELNRTLKEPGIVSLIIDYSDHYSHTDSSIGPLNYLNYTESEWDKFNHQCHFQNRLRHFDYLEILQRSGFRILEEDVTYANDPFIEPLKSRFAGSEQTWAATSGYILCGK